MGCLMNCNLVNSGQKHDACCYRCIVVHIEHPQPKQYTIDHNAIAYRYMCKANTVNGNLRVNKPKP